MPNPLENSERRITDAELEVATDIPAEDSTANSDSLDLGAAGVASLERAEMEIDVPALPNLSDGTDVTVTVQDSSDDSSFAAVDELSTVVVTGGGGTGSDAATQKVRLPSTTRRYVRISIATDEASGDNTAEDITYRLLT